MGLGGLRCQILVQALGQAGGAATLGGVDDAHYGKPALVGSGHHVAGTNQAAWLQGPLTVDADSAVGDEARSTRPRSYQPRAP